MTPAFTYVEVAPSAVASVTGDIWAAWRGAGGIGVYDDVALVITSGPGGAGRPMVATARPGDASPVASGGVFALRWFEIVAADLDEFVALSVEAWPSFESTNDATIEGLFRVTDVDAERAELLLVTRYPSLAGWETSRTTIRSDNTAGRNFLRRRELTRRSMVRIAGPMMTP